MVYKNNDNNESNVTRIVNSENDVGSEYCNATIQAEAEAETAQNNDKTMINSTNRPTNRIRQILTSPVG